MWSRKRVKAWRYLSEKPTLIRLKEYEKPHIYEKLDEKGQNKEVCLEQESTFYQTSSKGFPDFFDPKDDFVCFVGTAGI